ncbi:hypothetical protein FACS1894130_02740 [Spirochaetia bacterium]|nr:hypothetical protein FACS1894130_02740 [Spirochaetia bacterium]
MIRSLGAMRFSARKTVALLVCLLGITAGAFAQKTEFKLGAGFGAFGNVAFNNFFGADTKWLDFSGGAYAFIDANYVFLSADFWWGGHNTFMEDAGIGKHAKYGMSGITYNVLLQYPMDYVGGRSVLLLGLGIQTFTGMDITEGTPVDDLSKKSLTDLTSLWLRIGAGNHRSITDLLYYRYDALYSFQLTGEGDLKSGLDIRIALGFWII